ncbi:hypothetical protein J6590_007515 [Homalodisca vitripennis]|nr:hypothetical protein J6590_007515 [Homalodisca vitripennis]
MFFLVHNAITEKVMLGGDEVSKSVKSLDSAVMYIIESVKGPGLMRHSEVDPPEQFWTIQRVQTQGNPQVLQWHSSAFKSTFDSNHPQEAILDTLELLDMTNLIGRPDNAAIFKH